MAEVEYGNDCIAKSIKVTAWRRHPMKYLNIACWIIGESSQRPQSEMQNS